MQPVRSGRLPEDDGLELVSRRSFREVTIAMLPNCEQEKLSTVTGTRGSATP